MTATSQALYEIDRQLWLETTARQLKERDLAALDWQNLIEEIESLGREQKRKVKSYLYQLLVHLLLYRYWESEKAYCASGWEDEIENFRYELSDLLESKVLYNYSIEIFAQTYSDARKRVIRKTKLSPDLFPIDCPFSQDDVLDPDYLPDK